MLLPEVREPFIRCVDASIEERIEGLNVTESAAMGVLRMPTARPKIAGQRLVSKKAADIAATGAINSRYAAADCTAFRRCVRSRRTARTTPAATGMTIAIRPGYPNLR